MRTGAEEKLGITGGTKKDKHIIGRNKDPPVGRSHKFGRNRARYFKSASCALFCILFDSRRKVFHYHFHMESFAVIV